MGYVSFTLGLSMLCCLLIIFVILLCETFYSSWISFINDQPRKDTIVGTFFEKNLVKFCDTSFAWYAVKMTYCLLAMVMSLSSLFDTSDNTFFVLVIMDWLLIPFTIIISIAYGVRSYKRLFKSRNLNR